MSGRLPRRTAGEAVSGVGSAVDNAPRAIKSRRQLRALEPHVPSLLANQVNRCDFVRELRLLVVVER